MEIYRRRAARDQFFQKCDEIERRLSHGNVSIEDINRDLYLPIEYDDANSRSVREQMISAAEKVFRPRSTPEARSRLSFSPHMTQISPDIPSTAPRPILCSTPNERGYQVAPRLRTIYSPPRRRNDSPQSQSFITINFLPLTGIDLFYLFVIFILLCSFMYVMNQSVDNGKFYRPV